MPLPTLLNLRPRPARRVRSIAWPAVLVTAALAVAACGAGAGAGGDPAAAGPRPAAGGAFPVTIEHKFGSTEIAAQPQRVLTVGLVEQDALLALGITPIATTEWFGEQPGAVFSWARDELGSAAPPQVLTNLDGIQFEQVAALEPDLILGLYSGLTEQDYATLSRIAPTVAQPADNVDYGVSWQDLTRTVGLAVGRAEDAGRIVAGVEAEFAAVRAEHPEFAGTTAAVATPFEGYYVYGPQDPRSRFLADLGFEVPAAIGELTGEEFGAAVSRERLDLLDTDVLVWLVETQAQRDSILADPLYTAFAVTAQGRDVFLTESDPDDVYEATSFQTVLSLPFLLDELVPPLVAAADGDPATAVAP